MAQTSFGFNEGFRPIIRPEFQLDIALSFKSHPPLPQCSTFNQPNGNPRGSDLSGGKLPLGSSARTSTLCHMRAFRRARWNFCSQDKADVGSPIAKSTQVMSQCNLSSNCLASVRSRVLNPSVNDS